MHNQGEAEVVPGYQISRELQAWEQRWLKIRDYKKEVRFEYDEEKGKAIPMTPDVLGPVEYLVEQTEIHRDRIAAIKNGRITVVGLTQAELLLMAIDREYLLDNGEIQVVPNPNWTFEGWIAYMTEKGCI